MIISSKVVRGHGVASGMSNDPRYPKGTLDLQWPYFLNAGLPLDNLYKGTINVDVSPYSFQVLRPSFKLSNIKWSPHIPPENFFFFHVILQYRHKHYQGLIYMPDPTTKPEHYQPNNVLELLMPRIPDLNYGVAIHLDVDDTKLKFYMTKAGN